MTSLCLFLPPSLPQSFNCRVSVEGDDVGDRMCGDVYDVHTHDVYNSELDLCLFENYQQPEVCTQ